MAHDLMSTITLIFSNQQKTVDEVLIFISWYSVRTPIERLSDMVDLAGFIARPSTCTAHHEICNIVMAMCILSNLYLNVKITEKLKTQNEISGSGKLFFDFRGMYLALLAF